MGRSDRALEFRSGTRLRVGAAEYRVRWDERPREWVLTLGHGGGERRVRGSCAFGDGKPYAFLDDLQSALDELLVKEVLES